MTPEEIAYVNVPEIPNYRHPELDKLMQLKEWKKLFKEKLDVADRHTIRYYLHCCKNNSDFCSWTVPKIEMIVTKLNQAIERELNSRWVIKNIETGLYWCRIIEPPYWGRKNRAFLFNQETAEFWVRKFYKVTGDFRIQAVKIDATKRLK